LHANLQEEAIHDLTAASFSNLILTTKARRKRKPGKDPPRPGLVKMLVFSVPPCLDGYEPSVVKIPSPAAAAKGRQTRRAWHSSFCRHIRRVKNKPSFIVDRGDSLKHEDSNIGVTIRAPLQRFVTELDYALAEDLGGGA
jgi:hypothetical protein